MKKLALFTLFVTGALNALAGADGPGNSSDTVLRVPLFVEITSGKQPNPKYTYVPVAEFNKTLVQHGQEAQVAYVELSLGKKVDLSETREALDKAISAAGIQNVQAFGEYVPAQWGDKKNYTCYTGKAEDVVQIVQENVDSVYSDQYTLIAMKLGKKAKYIQAESRKQIKSKAWVNYDPKSDSVLLIASVGDDGTDVNESLIPRCK